MLGIGFQIPVHRSLSKKIWLGEIKGSMPKLQLTVCGSKVFCKLLEFTLYYYIESFILVNDGMVLGPTHNSPFNT